LGREAAGDSPAGTSSLTRVDGVDLKLPGAAARWVPTPQAVSVSLFVCLCPPCSNRVGSPLIGQRLVNHCRIVLCLLAHHVSTGIGVQLKLAGGKPMLADKQLAFGFRDKLLD